MPNCPDGHEMMEIGPGIGWCGCCTNHFAFKENTTTTTTTTTGKTVTVTRRKSKRRAAPAGYDNGGDALKTMKHDGWFSQGRVKSGSGIVSEETITDNDGFECFKRVSEPDQSRRISRGNDPIKVAKWRGWAPCCDNQIRTWLMVKKNEKYWFKRTCTNSSCNPGSKGNRWLILVSYDGKKVTEHWYEQ